MSTQIPSRAREVPRRFFLSGAAAVLAAACGRQTPRIPKATAAGEGLTFTPAFIELAPGDERLIFALFRNKRPIPFRSDGTGTLVAEGPSGRERPPAALRMFPIGRSLGGEDAKRQTEPPDMIFSARLPLDVAGPWSARVELELGGRKERVEGRFEVLDRSKTVATGEKAIVLPTPTQADPQGVDPICTRVPPCTMHEVSLEQAVRNGNPTVLILATPALCTSRMCGPDVDVVEAVHVRRPQEANFIHVEIYKDRSGQETTVPVKQWRLEEAGEPWVFFIGKDVIVRERLSGPVGEWEVDEALSRLRA